jgi:hypothetical protein
MSVHRSEKYSSFCLLTRAHKCASACLRVLISAHEDMLELDKQKEKIHNIANSWRSFEINKNVRERTLEYI